MEVSDKTGTGKRTNSFFVNGNKLALKINPSELAFETYLKTTNSTLTNEELTRKSNKSSGYEEIGLNTMTFLI